jgi:hypothetical protein
MAILQSFEQVAAGRFSPLVLLVPGLAMVVLGLVAWLAGMCLRRLVLALAGAVVAGMAGLLVSGPNAAVAGLAAGGGAVFGAVVPRLVTAILLAAIGLSIALVIVAKPHPAEEGKTLLGKPEAGRVDRRLTVRESLDVTWIYTLDIVDRARPALRALVWTDYAVLGAVALVLLALGLLFGRLAGALVCSVLGTALIAAGLIILLIYKGSAPIGLVHKQGALYSLVLLGMAAFGTLEQLVLCPAPRRRSKAGPRESRSRREESEHHWRGH